MGFSPHDDRDLIVRTAAGDDAAFEAFYLRYEPAVVGFHLRRTGGNRELAFDLAAETFAGVIVSSHRFDPAQAGSAAGWLFGIAANKLRESLRRGRVEASARERLAMEPVGITDDDLERVDALASLADERSIDELLSGLPEQQREAILARVVDERDYADIARDLQCSQAVARQRVARGLRTLRKGMEGAR
jgi:RNA polymerase sigma factor (sigma-70 family)